MAKFMHHPAVEEIAEALRSQRGAPRIADRVAFFERVAREAEHRNMIVETTARRHLERALRISLGDRGYEIRLRASIMRVPNGLVIWVTGPGLPGWEGRRYYETKTISVFDRVPRIFDDIDEAQPARDAQERAWKEQAERRALEQEERLERARLAELEKTREAKLLDAHARWSRVNDLRAYVVSLEVRIANMKGSELAEALEWVEWIRVYIDRIDPVNDSLRLPL